MFRVSPGGAPVWLPAIAPRVLFLRWPGLLPFALVAAGGALFGLGVLW